MATAKQMAALIRSFTEGDEAQFYRVALQVAAAEARKGHDNVARELRDLVEQARAEGRGRPRSPVPLGQPRGELGAILRCTYPKQRLRDMVLAPEVHASLDRFLREHRRGEALHAHGLSPRRKLLLAGPPGTGKTLTARTIAAELQLPLLAIRLETLITRFLGETAAKLRLVFDAMADTRGVYLFDEFDALGAERAAANDVGEMRRVLNSFLQFLEEDDSESVIIAATNHRGLLDRALFRRFDSVLRYELPTEGLVRKMFGVALASFRTDGVDFDVVVRDAQGLSQADIVGACEEAAKNMILDGRDELNTADLVQAVTIRKAAHAEWAGE